MRIGVCVCVCESSVKVLIFAPFMSPFTIFVPSLPLSISATEWHDNVVLRVLLRGLAEISISWSI